MKGTCTLADCSNHIYACGLCNKHYLRNWKYGSPTYYPQRPKKTCSVEGCDRKHVGLGFCQMHYVRQWKGGPVDAGRPSRLDWPSKYTIDQKTDCWNWKGKLSFNGYPIGMRAHRNLWERANGPVPAGKQLDHLCRNPRCVNPSHLEPVTPAENVRRGKNTKLKWADIVKIRGLIAGGMKHREVAELYPIGQPGVAAIATYRTWKVDAV